MNTVKRFMKLGSFITLVLILQMFLSQGVLAASRDYMVEEGKRVPIPETYILSEVFNNLDSLGAESGYLKEPQDIFINAEGYLFVADTGNNRIVKLTRDGKLAGIFKGPQNKPFNSPRGIYADEKGNMYVADTQNARIVHLSSDGEYIEEFTKPESELLGKDFTFDPTKLYVSPTGYIYVLKGQTFLTIDAHNRFRGYLGQSDIGFSLKDSLLRIFASAEQKRKIVKRTASVYTNLTMDEKGAIYATSLDFTEGEIKKLNSVGKNIYKKYARVKYTIPEIIKRGLSLEGKSYILGERIDDEGKSIKPLFKDITVDKNGILTALEGQTGKLYQYDQDGNLLAVFGGLGDQKGRFNMPCSLVADNDGRIYVLDSELANIQVFEPTEFIRNIHQAVYNYSKGNYDEAFEIWKQVLEIDENYRLAHSGLANALYKQENWKEAMEEYKLGEDREGYSKAYGEFRYEIFRRYFALVVVSLIALVSAMVFLIGLMNRTSAKALEQFRRSTGKMDVPTGLKMSLGAIFHPIETFENIKSGRGRLNLLPGVIILIAVFTVRIFHIMAVHFPLADVDFNNSNIWLEAVKLLLPPITWVIASFAISAIHDGESKPGEIFLATCYSMVPYVVVVFPLTLLSRILTRNEVVTYGMIFYSTWIWILLLFFISLKTLNDYRVFRTGVIYVVSGATMVLTWFVALLGYVLTGKIFQFITGIVHEIQMALL